MDQLSAMRVFVRVVETGSFSAAAKALKIPNSTVTNLIQNLEAHLETKLLNRTTRRVFVTTDGALYFEQAAALVSGIDQLDERLKNSHAAPGGRLRVEMTGAIAEMVIVPALADFRSRYPDIKIELGVSDRSADYLAENIDCAIRAGVPSDQSMIVRKVAVYDFVTCASPDYLNRYGIPKDPKALEGGHSVIRYFQQGTGQSQSFKFYRGAAVVDVEPNVSLAVNDARTLIRAIKAGYGIGQSSRLLVRGDLEQGDLVQILPEWSQPSVPLHIVYPPNKHMSSKVRVFVDWVSDVFADQL